jgi:hypothetical protein
VFGYGSEHRDGGERSGGLVTFLDDTRAVFADRLDGSGTVLSVVASRGDDLRVEAQAITGAPLRRLPFGSWSWQNRWVSHLQPLGEDAFVLAELDGGVALFSVSEGAIHKTDHFRFQGVAGPIEGMASSRNGRVWACIDGISQFARGADGKLQRLPGVQREGEVPHCSSIGASPNGTTLLASTPQGIIRWEAGDEQPQAELLMPGVIGLIRGVSSELLLLQARAKLDAFGELLLYRLSDGQLVGKAEPSATDSPFSTTLVEERWVTAWDAASAKGALHRQFLSWGTAAEPATSTWHFRERREPWLEWQPNYEALASRGSQLLLQPWRRWLALDASKSVRELTGPGHGSIVQLASLGSDAALALGPYGYATLELGEESLTFDSGGVRSQWGFDPAQRVVIDASGVRAFVTRSALLAQPTASSSLLVVAPTAEGPSHRGTVEVGGGPALLVPRGAGLIQLSPLDDESFALRRYTLEPTRSSTELAPESTVTLVVGPSSRGPRASFTVEVDDEGREALVLESWQTQTGFERRLSWFRILDGARATRLGSAELPPNTGAPVVALGRHAALVFDGDTVHVMRQEDGALTRSTTRYEGQVVFGVLGLDRGERIYVARSRGAREELAVFDDLGQLRSVLTLPGRALSLAVTGQSLLVSTNSSVHRLTASCGDVQPSEPEPWPIMDAADWLPPSPSGCRALLPCQTWQPPVQAGDVDRDGCVDAEDAAIVTRCYTAVADPCRESVLADLNGNGVVDDYPVVIANFGKGCSP